MSNKLLNRFFKLLQTTVFLLVQLALFTAFTATASAAGAAGAADASVPSVVLTKPSEDASFTETSVEFEFIPKSESTGPLSCELYVDNVKTGETNAVSGFPALITAELQPGSHSWLVSCTDENLRKGESKARKINVAIQAQQQASIQSIEDKSSAALTGFSVLTGAVVAGQAEYLESWRAVVGDIVSFSANASNTGESNFTATLVVKVRDGKERLVAVTRSKPVYVVKSASVKLKADWIPLKEGEYYAEGAIIDENEKVFQQSFIKIVVSPKSAAGETALFIAILSLMVVAAASFATQKNIKNIKSA